MRKIIYTRPDGGLSVVHPARNTIGETLTTDAEIEQRAFDRLPKNAINPQFVAEDAIPKDRTFRNAWVASGGAIDHDIDKCKALAHERRRLLREAEFKPLDVEATIPAKAAAAEAARQAIRDKYAAKQAAIDAAATVDQIKAALS